MSDEPRTVRVRFPDDSVREYEDGGYVDLDEVELLEPNGTRITEAYAAALVEKLHPGCAAMPDSP